MTERENLPAIIAAQGVTVLTEHRASLVGRGLKAIQNNKVLTPTQNYYDLYQRARKVFDQATVESSIVGAGILIWSERGDPTLFSALKIFEQLARKNYGKAFYPLAILCDGQYISALLEQDELRLKRRPFGTQYVGEQIREIVRNRTPFQNYTQLAFLWCIANQSNDDVELWCDLGKIYSHGHGVEKNVEQAVFWYRKAAEQGHVKAQNMMAQCYIEGHGVPEDFQLAMSWFQKAAKQGDAKAQYEIGTLYSIGWGVPEDDAKAASWYRKAAEQGYAEGQWKLGEMYRKGRGVEKDNEEAEYWYRKAAENNDDPNWYHKYRLGEMYREGDGVKKNDEQAVFWLRKAAELGFAQGQWEVGEMYGKGRGTAKDNEQAEYWYRKAAEHNDEPEPRDYKYRLGEMYRKGNGVKQNNEQAMFWLRKSANRGDSDAKDALRKLGIDWKK